MALKKTCTKHYRWMQIRRALIDMERLTQLLRLEELTEESRCIQTAQHSRGNVLALLLHRTISHDESSSSSGQAAKGEEVESLKKEIDEEIDHQKKEESMDEKIDTASKSTYNNAIDQPQSINGGVKFPSTMSQKIDGFGLTFEQRQNDLEKGVYGD